MKDLTSREILDAIDRGLEKVSQQFAKDTPAMPVEPPQAIPAGQTKGGDRQAGKSGAA